MGDIAEMIQEGILCEVCGGLVGNEPKSVGYPRKCDDCRKPDYMKQMVKKYGRNKRKVGKRNA